jgi:hypothetical protein
VIFRVDEGGVLSPQGYTVRSMVLSDVCCQHLVSFPLHVLHLVSAQEVILDTTDPDWATTFTVNYHFEIIQQVTADHSLAAVAFRAHQLTVTFAWILSR